MDYFDIGEIGEIRPRAVLGKAYSRTVADSPFCKHTSEQRNHRRHKGASSSDWPETRLTLCYLITGLLQRGVLMESHRGAAPRS